MSRPGRTELEVITFRDGDGDGDGVAAATHDAASDDTDRDRGNGRSSDEAGRVAVLDQMRSLAEGGGWITFDPAYDDRFPPPSQSVFGRLLTGRGPAVPRATWVPAELDRRRPEPVSVGILHATGSRSVERLAEDHDVAVPDRWRVAADHSKRGLVLYVPIDVAHDDVLAWTLRATAALTRIPLTGEWRATIHRTAGSAGVSPGV